MKPAHRLLAVGGAIAAGLVVVGTAIAVPNTQAQPATTATAAQAQANASNAVAAMVANPPAALHASGKDKFTQKAVRSAGGLNYVAYTRSYKDLEVIGGDFVVATDDQGTVKATSVAQDSTLGEVDTASAKLSQAGADAIALKQVTGGKSNGAGRKVVVAEGSGRLAYESNVIGKDEHGHLSALSVYVDAQDGRVLRTVEHLAEGTGTGYWNGPNLPLNTTKSGSTYSLKDPSITGLDCRDYSSGSVFSGSDDSWGNGTATNKETGCADALFVAQTENKMLSQWVGRNSFDGQGGAWKINVGLDENNAYYYSSRPAYVNLGHNPQGQWVGSLDILGHEMGHGIDDHSGSGGFSGGGTQEFIGDTFGTATEWFANEPSTYDEPDYIMGEDTNLVGSGPIRYMYKPSLHGSDPNCYSSSVPNMEVHAAAGPGNHWFYLLAEGSNPSNGQPVSPTCNNTTLQGIGIQKAIKIMHGAVQLKTSSSSYLKYRTWTLTAAKNLYQGSCAEFNAVKAAWDAVSVPAQSADPTCTGGTTPPSSTTTPPTTTSSPTTTTPPTTTTQPPGGCSGQKILNPGFESGKTNWSDPNTTIGNWTSYREPARSGTQSSWLGGWGSSHTDTVSQSVTIPTGCRATLSFYLHIDSAETENLAYDKLTVSLGSTAVASFSNTNKAAGYVQKTYDVSSLAGQTVTLKFAGSEDSNLQTSFVLDDLALTLG
ncbi:Zn-dependent metalloprotease [Actinokineospora baliensis]|uniref:M4 family metallopeptidase n=1 Tax=Actinokineospora baliensis TaxID=547056 RepID=UPI001956C92A|nr:M4 family metallopeptidase [Actinokineospora baliensis]MBM7772239.1 Zn-dependent metalloprotease [Actinokineospora baliensis]